MVHLGNVGRGQSPLGFDGGGLGGVIVPLAVVGLAGWAAYELFAISVVLAAGIAAYVVLVLIYLYALSQDYSTHEGAIRFFLIASVFAAAATAFLVFQVGFMRFFVGDAMVVVLLLAALLVGLWSILSWLLRAVTVAALALLIAAPFSEEIQRNEKWDVDVIVRDEFCARVRNPDAKCQLISELNGEVLDEKGPVQANEYGRTGFTFDGNPLGKKARCEASTNELGSATAIAEPTWIFRSQADIRLAPADRQLQPCPED